MESLSLWASFEFRQAWWLVGLLFPLIWWAYQAWWLQKQQTDYAQAEFWPWVLVKSSGKARPNWLLFGAWFALIVALAGPRIEQTHPVQSDRTGVDVLVLLDSSRSMSAQDVQPNRFVLAQNILQSLAQRLQADDRIGLMTFSYQTHWVSPLTLDKALFTRNLYLLEPNILPMAGSLTDQALAFALSEAQKTKRAPLVVLLVTDSVNAQQETSLNQVTQALQTQQAKLLLMGVGNTQTVYLPDTVHPSGWLHDDNRPVDVALDRPALQALAQQAQGKYFDASEQQSLIETLIEQISAAAQPVTTPQVEPEYQDFALYFVAMALVLLLWALRLPRWARSPLSFVGLVWIIGFLPNHQAWSSDAELLAHQAFEQKQFEQAERLYQQLAEPYKANFGAGNAAYRQTHYERALVFYRQALLNSDSDTQRAKVLFNIGNSYAQLGAPALAVESFQAALLYRPEFSKAQHNLDLAQAEMTKLQEMARLEQEKAAKEQEREAIKRDLEGSFHGGQKPDPNNEAGSGAEGESDDGRSEGVAFSVPERALLEGIDDNAKWQLSESQTRVQSRLAQQRRIEKLQLELEALQDDQQALIRHIFEREAGFQAKQDKVHSVPGVQPW